MSPSRRFRHAVCDDDMSCIITARAHFRLPHEYSGRYEQLQARLGRPLDSSELPFHLALRNDTESSVPVARDRHQSRSKRLHSSFVSPGTAPPRRVFHDAPPVSERAGVPTRPRGAGLVWVYATAELPPGFGGCGFGRQAPRATCVQHEAQAHELQRPFQNLTLTFRNSTTCGEFACASSKTRWSCRPVGANALFSPSSSA